MAYSQRYHELKLRTRLLRKRFLPSRFSKTGTYSEAQLDFARAFRVLAHAELETYFEDRTQEIVDAALGGWQSGHRLSTALVAMIVSFGGTLPALPKSLPQTSAHIDDVVARAHQQVRHRIRQNHGIRTKNLLGLLIPVGIPESQIDQTWLATIDGFGSKRGDVAHSTAVPHRVSYTIDPRDDWNTVNTILAGMRDLDLAMNQFLREAR